MRGYDFPHPYFMSLFRVINNCASRFSLQMLLFSSLFILFIFTGFFVQNNQFGVIELTRITRFRPAAKAG
jgi:hypothetical protein